VSLLFPLLGFFALEAEAARHHRQKCFGRPARKGSERRPGTGDACGRAACTAVVGAKGKVAQGRNHGISQPAIELILPLPPSRSCLSCSPRWLPHFIWGLV
jgi:hypothetical protein